MAKNPKRRRAPTTAERASLAQPLLDQVVGPPEPPPVNKVDVTPLLVALRTGVLDGHLAEIAGIVNDRLRAIEVIEELIAASKLRAGDRAHLGHNLRPNYLHGRPVTIIGKDGDKWLVRLDEPVGKFVNADLRVYATQLEPISGT